MFDVATLKSWVGRIGFGWSAESASTLRLEPRGEGAASLPPFYAQCTTNWLVLSIVPLAPRGAGVPNRWLLERCRAMRVAKLALTETGEIVLGAELPTESLDFEELEDAVLRMVEYAHRFRRELGLS